MQGWFNIQKLINVIYHINKLKKKNHVITSIDGEKAFDKTQRQFMIKNCETRNKGKFPQLDKSIYKTSTPNFIPNGERLNAFSLRLGTGQGCLLSPLLFSIVLEVLATAMKQEKGGKGIDWKGRNKTISIYRL